MQGVIKLLLLLSKFQNKYCERITLLSTQPKLSAYFPYSEENKSRLMRSACCLLRECVSLNYVLTPAPIFMKLCTYIMTPEAISAAYFTNPLTCNRNTAASQTVEVTFIFLKCLNRSSWNLACMSCHLGSSQWHSSQIIPVSNINPC
jgi:hypothetical protein